MLHANPGEQRSEDKKLEHRSALTPNTVRKLLEKGFAVNVEKSPVRIFEDREFEEAGATLVETGSWPDAPDDHFIIGLKELLEEDCASFNSNHRCPDADTTFVIVGLKHTHIQFAHCYKGQGVCASILFDVANEIRRMGPSTCSIPTGRWNAI